MSKVNIRDSVRRTEDIRFVSGQGSYIDDMNGFTAFVHPPLPL